MSIIALEASTSSIKGFILDHQQQVVWEEQWTYGTWELPFGQQDIQDIGRGFLEVLDKLILHVKEDVEAIILSSVWSSLLFLSEDMKPISPLYTWADMSQVADFDKLEKQDEEAISGCPWHLKFPRCKLTGLWKVYKGENTRISSLPEYIFHLLTGVWSTTKQSASGTGLLNLKTGQWSEEILSKIHIENKHLAPLHESAYYEPLGDSAKNRLKLTLTQKTYFQDTVVTFPNGDGGMNQYAASGMKEDVVSMSVGTSAAVRRVVGPGNNHSLVHGLWRHYLKDGHYVQGATIPGAGTVIKWFNDKYAAHIHIDILAQRLVMVSSDECLTTAPIFLPFVYGEQSMGWKNCRSYGFSESPGEVQVEILFYSVLEGILFNLYQGFKALVGEAEEVEIHVSGGILLNKIWLEMASNLFGRPLIAADYKDQSLFGNIMLYLEHMGRSHELRLQGERIEPDMEQHRRLMDRYEQFLVYYEGDGILYGEDETV